MIYGGRVSYKENFSQTFPIEPPNDVSTGNASKKKDAGVPKAKAYSGSKKPASHPTV